MRIHESEIKENKRSLGEIKDIIKSVAAFATCSGGTIHVGIDPDTGDQVGVQIGQNTLENLARDIRMHTDPPQYPSIRFEGEEQSAIIVISVEPNPVKPVLAYGRAYKRVGRSNQSLLREEVQRLIEQTTGHTWDTLPCLDVTLADIDEEAIKSFLRRAGQEVSTSVATVLRNLGFITASGEICNGAVLLFARNPQRFFPQAQVKCARFIGITPVNFLDEITIAGPILRQLDDAYKFITRNTRQSIQITGKAEHAVVSEYPVKAVREALNNAVCHRDYASTGTVQVRIYDDRLEVWNPGVLPPEITVADLFREHPSYPRNPRVAQALYVADVIEQFGTGTLRIVESCRDCGIPEPEFNSDMGVFMVRLRHLIDVSELPQYAQLNERQKAVIKYVQEHGRIKSSEYQDEFLVGERQASNDLSDLVELNIFERKGAGPATYYILANIQQMRD